MPAWFAAPLLAGGLGALGSWLQNRGQKAAAREQMAFQERMSSTSYQRAVEDMRLSGINPMLAYMQGGASSPGGAQANISDMIGPAVSSASAARRLTEEIKGMIQQRDINNMLANREQVLKAEQTANVVKDSQLKDANIENVHANTAKSLLETAVLRAELPGAQLKGRVAGSGFGTAMEYIERARQAIFGGSTVGLILPRMNQSFGTRGAGKLGTNRDLNAKWNSAQWRSKIAKDDAAWKLNPDSRR